MRHHRRKKSTSPAGLVMSGILFCILGLFLVVTGINGKKASDEFMKDAIPVTVEFTKVWKQTKRSGTGRHRRTTTHYYASGYYTYEGVSYNVNKISTNSSAHVGNTTTVYIHKENPADWRKEYTATDLFATAGIGVFLLLIGFGSAISGIKKLKERSASSGSGSTYSGMFTDKAHDIMFDDSRSRNHTTPYGTGSTYGGSTYGDSTYGGGSNYGGSTYGDSTYGGGSNYGGSTYGSGSSYGSQNRFGSAGDSYGGHYSSTDFYTGYYDENDTDPNHVNY